MTEIDQTLRSIIKTFKMPIIKATAPVSEAIIEMIDNDVYALLVPRKDKHDAYGIVTKKDIIRKVIAGGKDPRKAKVGDIMSKPLILLTNLNLDVRWVAKAMTSSEVSVIAVFDSGDFYGFVTDNCVIEGIYHASQRKKLDTDSEYVSC